MLQLFLTVEYTQTDQMNTLEREKDFKEEQFDYVQQTLRTIALKCTFLVMLHVLSS